jgi:hypothetical protein
MLKRHFAFNLLSLDLFGKPVPAFPGHALAAPRKSLSPAMAKIRHDEVTALRNDLG